MCSISRKVPWSLLPHESYEWNRSSIGPIVWHAFVEMRYVNASILYRNFVGKILFDFIRFSLTFPVIICVCDLRKKWHGIYLEEKNGFTKFNRHIVTQLLVIVYVRRVFRYII